MSTSGNRARSFAQPAQLPNQTFTFPAKLTQQSVLGRFDQALSTQDHLAVRVSAWSLDAPFELASTAHPTGALSRTQKSFTVFGTWSKVLSERALQEVKVGYNKFDWNIGLAFPSMAQTPQLVFPGLTIGGSRNYPQVLQRAAVLRPLRPDAAPEPARSEARRRVPLVARQRGTGAGVAGRVHLQCAAGRSSNGGFRPTASTNPAAWDLTGLDSLVQRYDLNVGDWSVDIPRPQLGDLVGRHMANDRPVDAQPGRSLGRRSGAS